MGYRTSFLENVICADIDCQDWGWGGSREQTVSTKAQLQNQLDIIRETERTLEQS